MVLLNCWAPPTAPPTLRQRRDEESATTDTEMKLEGGDEDDYIRDFGEKLQEHELLRCNHDLRGECRRERRS